MLMAGLIAGFVCIKFIFLFAGVKTESMEPALKPGDKIVINRISKIRNGDIIALRSPAEDDKIVISRIIASEYETVEIRNKVVYINEKMYDIVSESTRDSSNIYPMKFCYRDNMPPVRMGRNEFFVLGDNFDRSFDSRIFGKVSKSAIIGKMVYKK